MFPWSVLVSRWCTLHTAAFLLQEMITGIDLYHVDKTLYNPDRNFPINPAWADQSLHDGPTPLPLTSYICTEPHTALSGWFIKATHDLSLEHWPVIVVLWRDTHKWEAGHKKYVCLLQAVESRRNQWWRRILVFFLSGHLNPAYFNTAAWNEPRLHAATQQ